MKNDNEWIYTRIKSYLKSGEFTGCEHIYARDKEKAIEWFRRDYPAHKDCIIIAEAYDPADSPEHFEVCKACGCVHYWK